MPAPSGRRVVYSAMFGGYEAILEQPVAVVSDVDFIFFTDDPTVTSDTWQVRHVDPLFPLDSVRSARAIKIRGHELLGGYSESLWIDNSVRLKVAPELILDHWLEGRDIALPAHSFRHDVTSEFAEIIQLGYDDPNRVYEQLMQYGVLSPDVLAERPYWTALIARRDTPHVRSTMSLWMDHVLRFSRRDQLSINFAIASTGIEVSVIAIDNHDSHWHEWPVAPARKWGSRPNRFDRMLRLPLSTIEQLEEERDSLSQELARERAEFEQQLEAQRDLIHNEYQTSKSWRLTKWLRVFMGGVGSL